jgi:acetyl-CoA acetyltransferase
MKGFPRGDTAIVGAATFGIGEAAGFESIDIAAHAGLLALDGAGITLADVDALFLCLPDDMLSGLTLAEYYGLHPKITENNRTGGSAFMTHVMWAAHALAAGECDTALIAYGSNQRTKSGKLLTPAGLSFWEAAYKPLLPISCYALAASRHMYQFGTTREQLAEVAAAARGWANLNPDAFAKGPLTIDDVLAARMVSSPLGLRDCCLVTDGGAAIVMTRADRAKDHALRPAYVLGAAAETTHRDITFMPDLTVSGAALSGQRAYEQAGLGPKDMDVVEIYDAFTINTILFLEDLGFCPKGEGGRFVQDGRIAPGGDLPVNTNGGGLSCVHPGMYGLFTLVEATQQIGGTAGARQIKDVNTALCHGNGGVLSSQATVILGSDATR